MKNPKEICDLFVGSIRDNKTIPPTFEDGLSVQKVMDAAIESGETGTWVSV